MKVVVGSFQQESNSFSPARLKKEDFEFVTDEEIFNKLPVRDIFEEEKIKLVPTIYANTLPGGEMPRETFEYFKEQLLSRIPDNGEEIAGVWLYLHGAMIVENLGSGEEILVSEIRKKVGRDIPIALALDFHANNSRQLIDMVNIVCGFKTAPHTDQKETQIKAAQLLTKCLNEEVVPETIIEKPPLMMPGDQVYTEKEPMKSLIEESNKLENSEEILAATIFNGTHYSDSPNTGASIVITVKDDIELARKEAHRLAKKFWEVRWDFEFDDEPLEPERAIEKAINSDPGIILVTDSGDNTTAGAPGDNVFLLQKFINKLEEQKIVPQNKILFAGITDSRAVKKCNKLQPGSAVEIEIGAEIYKEGKTITLEGKFIKEGRMLGWGGEDIGKAILINYKEIDIIISENRNAFITIQHFEKAGVDINDYDVVVVKQGYLFPELRQLADHSIMALTPGTTDVKVSNLNYNKINHPIFPCDKDFKWK